MRLEMRPANPNPSAKRVKPEISTVLRPYLSAKRPATVLVMAATIIRTENRLPASISESANDCLISGKAIPNVATIIDGIKLEQGTMQSVKRPRCGAPSGMRLLMGYLLLYRNSHVDARLVTDHAGDMTATAGIVGEHDIAFAETSDGAVTGLDLYFAR